MRTLGLLATLALLPLPLALTAGTAEASVMYCAWNHALLPDQYVTYTGYGTVTVGVRFVDGPICQVQVVCWGDLTGRPFACRIPPLP